MILLDTCALIHSSLSPERLGKNAATMIEHGVGKGSLACSDISLWEIAMLISRGRLRPDAESSFFIQQVVRAHRLSVLPITADIAVLSSNDALFSHKDPCDRIIAATALSHSLPILTNDNCLKDIAGLITVW